MDDDDVIDVRIKRASSELKECTKYDYIIINDDLNRASREAESIIISDRCSNSRMLPRIKQMLRL
jgi:guanylate kinase